jgi:hypothetical protein
MAKLARLRRIESHIRRRYGDGDGEYCRHKPEWAKPINWSYSLLRDAGTEPPELKPENIPHCHMCGRPKKVLIVYFDPPAWRQ